ncbi:hypothetical protein GCM10007919_44690 [Rhizobium indigoferae]|nr:hypothetical protein GCM10007919_44690 [Rhizobium indigoferae]
MMTPLTARPLENCACLVTPGVVRSSGPDPSHFDTDTVNTGGLIPNAERPIACSSKPFINA